MGPVEAEDQGRATRFFTEWKGRAKGMTLWPSERERLVGAPVSHLEADAEEAGLARKDLTAALGDLHDLVATNLNTIRLG